MNKPLRIALHQSASLVGAVDKNTETVIQAVELAEQQAVDLVVFPELFLCGYPPEDLLFRVEMQTKIEQSFQALAQASYKTAILIGTPFFEQGKIYNAAVFFSGGLLTQVHKKRILPNYSVFDEQRYFTAGTQQSIVELAGFRLLLSICEEIWAEDAAVNIDTTKVDIHLSIHGSPFHLGKPKQRLELVSKLAVKSAIPLCYLNLVGCQDELIFDGGSIVCDDTGSLVGSSRQFGEDRIVCCLHRNDAGTAIVSASRTTVELADDEQIFRALTMCLRDYVINNGFSSVILGLSGGIDSALVLVIACAALGSDKVKAVMMPYKYTSSISLEDARKLATNCKVDYREIAVDDIVETTGQTLELNPSQASWSVTWQNIQARTRGLLLMAMSNYYGDLLLATGNKSEMAVGYATLYGDMCGGFAPLKDIDKTSVYRLAQFCNRYQQLIPERIITRAPSAELAPDQKDSDTLPEYGLLDQILSGYIEEGLSLEDLTKIAGADQVSRVIAMVDSNEYKRRKAAIGPRVTRLGFGKDRRMPITQLWSN